MRQVIDAAQSMKKDSFARIVTSFVQKARDSAKRAEVKAGKIQQKMMSQSDLKVILKGTKMSPEEAQAKRKRAATKGSQQNMEYEGHWENDVREGWGVSKFKNGD